MITADTLKNNYGYKINPNDQKIIDYIFSSDNELSQHDKSNLVVENNCCFNTIRYILDNNYTYILSLLPLEFIKEIHIDFISSIDSLYNYNIKLIDLISTNCENNASKFYKCCNRIVYLNDSEKLNLYDNNYIILICKTIEYKNSLEYIKYMISMNENVDKLVALDTNKLQQVIESLDLSYITRN